MAEIIYFSSITGNTARFVDRLGRLSGRIPHRADGKMPQPRRPFVLICPTFADGTGRGAVPKAVIRFLNDPARRSFLRGVIGAGNRNFGQTYALSAQVIAQKCAVPILYRFELAGTETDLCRVSAGLDKFWRTECLTTA